MLPQRKVKQTPTPGPLSNPQAEPIARPRDPDPGQSPAPGEALSLWPAYQPGIERKIYRENVNSGLCAVRAPFLVES